MALAARITCAASKSRGRAIAGRGDHEPDEQMNRPANGGRRRAATFQGGDEAEGARIGGGRRRVRQICQQLKNLRRSNGGRVLLLVRCGIVSWDAENDYSRNEGSRRLVIFRVVTAISAMVWEQVCR